MAPGSKDSHRFLLTLLNWEKNLRGQKLQDANLEYEDAVGLTDGGGGGRGSRKEEEGGGGNFWHSFLFVPPRECFLISRDHFIYFLPMQQPAKHNSGSAES